MVRNHITDIGQVYFGLIESLKCLINPLLMIVDIRKNSSTFKKWFGCELSEKNKKQLWIPPGFAHGFYVLSPTCEFLYKTTDFYYPEFEKAIIWNDPEIQISWPFQNNFQPKLSEKDKKAVFFSRAELPD